MPITFLVPAFLIGLAALAVPIIIHLTRKETKDAVDFPSLMFVQRIPHRSTSRRRIRNWPLLLLRCLAIALITAAFARPFFSSGDGSANAAITTGSREMVVLLDRSYSMGYGDRWGRAQAAAIERLDDLNSTDRGSVVLFDSRSEAVVESSPDRALLRSAVEGAEPGPRATRFAPALRHAERLLAGSPHPRRELVIISDFQRSGWQADESELSSINLPAQTNVTAVPITSEGESNISVASVTFDRTVASAGAERAIATARLVNRGAEARADIPVTLEIGGRPIESKTVSLDPNGSGSVQFAPVTLGASGMTRGVVRTPDDALAADNAFHFALSPDQRIGVVVVDGGGQGSYFLQRSLAIGSAPGFRTLAREDGALRAADLTLASVVVLNQASLPTGEVGRRLRAFVENGGGLILMVGENRTGEWDGALPNLAGRTVDHTGDGGTALGFLDFAHPALEVFSAPRSGDFTEPRFYRYRAIAEAPGQRVLARFSDGGAALVEHAVGNGRVLVWASMVDAQWNDLAVQPVFLPFVHQLTKYAAGYAPPQPAFTVGDAFDPGVAAAASHEFGIALTPEGERINLEETGPMTLDEPGFYELRDARTGAEASALAVNVDPNESQLETVPVNDVIAAISPSSDEATRARGSLTLTIQERERAQSAWWYLVVVGFLLLAAETVLSNWRRKTNQQPVSG